jgi:hypothetical protein
LRWLFLRPVAFLAVRTLSKQGKPVFLPKIDAKRMQLLCFERLATKMPALIVSAFFEPIRPVSTKKRKKNREISNFKF